MIKIKTVSITLAWLMVATLVRGAVTPVTPATSKLWINHCMPLPHEIAISGAVAMPPANLRIRLAPEAGVAEQQAVSDLNEWLKAQTNAASAGAAFEIVIGTVDARGNLDNMPVALAARLRSLPNKEQAYVICPQGKNRLLVAGLTGKGVYYGVQTLRQLLEAKLTRDLVTVPLATVTDWPDMDERGVWNGEVMATPALAALKLNFQTYICGYTAETNGLLKPRLNQEIMELLKRHAMVERVQMIHHLNYFGTLSPQLYVNYPELKGKGEKAVPRGESIKFAKSDIANICASQPFWEKIVAGILSDLAAQGARDVSVWMSEFEGQCQCAECLRSTQVESETRLILAAWREACRAYPDLKLRVLFSLGDDSAATIRALKILPPEVKIERVYGVRKPFLDAAAQGRWVLVFNGHGVYGTHLRFIAPDKFARPIKDSYAAKLNGVLSISAHYIGDKHVLAAYYPQVYNYEISAIAEWSWNVNGRTPREFMEAWGARQGYGDPSRFADWAETMGKLSSLLGKSIWGMDVRNYGNSFRVMAEKIGRCEPVACYSTQALAQAKELCRQALAIAEALNRPEAAVETRYLAAYLDLQEKVSALSDRLAAPDLAQANAQRRVQEAADAFKSAVETVLEAKSRQIELGKGEPADYPKKVNLEIRTQWEKIMQDVDASVAERLQNPGATVKRN